MPRILIVEDEPDIAMVLQNDLQAEGYETEIAGDGEMAIRRAKEGNWDLVLLDVMLPLKDGFEVCREIRRARIQTRIIMLTAKSQEAEKVMGLELGADDYVTKPFSPRELRARAFAPCGGAKTKNRAFTGSATAKWISIAANCGVRAALWRPRRWSLSCFLSLYAGRGRCSRGSN
ncbi:MAG TPA: response regulator [Bryobacteraceae bacterium]|nr:response regulator [Bryobacteraceae bacterium]